MSIEYRPISEYKWRAMLDSFRKTPQEDGRFAGTNKQQAHLAEQMRDMFDDDPGPDVIWLGKMDVLGLADDLQKAQSRWSIGQYSSALASLIKPNA